MQAQIHRLRQLRHAMQARPIMRTKFTGPYTRNNNPGISALPAKMGLYDPKYEHDNCGVGFVANVKGIPSAQVILDGRDMMERMEHRGATGEDPNTGDGAGILLGMPDSFLRKAVKQDCDGVVLPPKGQYAAGIVFLNPDESAAEVAKATFEEIASNMGLSVLCWRPVPTDNSALGDAALATEPVVEQVFLKPFKSEMTEQQLERTAYVLTKRVSNLIRGSSSTAKATTTGGGGGSYGADPPHKAAQFEAWDQYFYINSLSTRTMTYKGQLTCEQVFMYYKDLCSEDMESHIALVHSRFSTNTFPSWDRAQPLRMMAHNGEINTVTGNRNWMQAREGILKSNIMTKEELDSIYPIIDASGSDSAHLDDAVQFLTHATDRKLHEILFMMAPEAWENHATMAPELRGFYKWASNVMEPWDGPVGCALGQERMRVPANSVSPFLSLTSTPLHARLCSRAATGGTLGPG